MRRLAISAMPLVIGILVVSQNVSFAQLRVTEILADSKEEPAYEWIEVENTSGAPLSLANFVYDDNDSTALSGSNIVVDDLNTAIIPANGVAVLYNAQSLGSDGARFRAAWNLAESVPLIAVDLPPGLNNGGDQIGLWPTFEDYQKDLVDAGDGAFEVGGFDNATFFLDFSENPFPSPKDASIYFTGEGDINDGANWIVSAAGDRGAYESSETFFQTAQINSTEDLASPGVVPEGNAANGLLITEIMYNPSSTPDNAFEFVEIYNNTGSEIDFSQTNFFLDDLGGDAFENPNITSGIVANGETAVLFNGDSLTVEQMKVAWGEDLNAIPVAQFSALNNGDDAVGLWQDSMDYASDKERGIFLDALATVAYVDGDEDWPSDNGAASIYLTDLNASMENGANWSLSNAEDGLSFNAKPIFQDMLPDHPGGEIGSPGKLPGQVTSGDFDKNGVLDVDDLDTLTNAVVAGNQELLFDVNADGTVDGIDREFWVESIMNTYIGDSNLDGEFGSGDLVAVFQPGEYEDAVEDNSTWAEGDWNGDLDFGTADLVFAFQRGGFELGPRQDVAAAVPEPNSITGLLLFLGIAISRLRKNQVRS